MQQEDDSRFQYRLREILVSTFKILATPSIHPDAGIASIEFGYNFSYDFKSNAAICKMHFKVFVATDLKDLANGQTEVLFGEIHYIYEVLNLKKYVIEEEGKSVLEIGVLMHLVQIAYSTSRGVIYERTRGYGINNLLLPVLNMGEYIKEQTREAATAPNVFEPPS